MNFLDNFTTEELEKEIALRKNTQIVPTRVENPDWETFSTSVNKMLEEAVKEQYWDDDNKQYIFEKVMETIYGPTFWTWFNNTKLTE